MSEPTGHSQPTATIGTSTAHWLARGVAVGVMLVAACNALSYFFRSASIADLIGKDQEVVEALGFPYEIWQEDKIYHGSLYIDYFAVSWNLLVGLTLGCVLGVIAVSLKDHFNRWVADFEKENNARTPAKLQFSVRSLLIMTTIAAALIAVMTQWHGTPEVLIAIYFAGPITLILIAMAPSNIRWQHRIVILTILAFAMIGIALSSGHALSVSLDRVLLGIFVSWTPQSAFAAFLLIVGLSARIWISEKHSKPTSYA